MNLESRPLTVCTLDRLNLRLPEDTVEAIDAARAHRAGIVSRNTWIAEAIREKLAREHIEVNLHSGGQKSHG
ncbi:ribbon-helix-helix domain-containing protein [Burkholderia sp. Leaf177]|uniref:ribbon-helix-helix domain-containing protein n=1 Tax=Burkholderia sp. Leaf177 TaxID=1736287 RepID=UPI0009ECB1DA|nr:ribbon-helix-helix domain-containing protein [Burkholderia sp. Leaf177]